MLVDLCNALDEFTEQEKTAELLPISVQQLYVLSKLGKTEEAERLASDISLQEYEGCISHVLWAIADMALESLISTLGRLLRITSWLQHRQSRIHIYPTGSSTARRRYQRETNFSSFKQSVCNKMDWPWICWPRSPTVS